MEGGELLQLAKDELKRSNVDKRHPFKFAVFSTFGAHYPESRYVVKRGINDQFEMIFYTDSRTPKVNELRHNNKCAVLYYHPQRKLQLRFKGEVSIIEEGAEYEKHKTIVIQHPGDYNTENTPGSVLTEDLMRASNVNLSVLIFRPLELDLLQLNREGHKRYMYKAPLWDPISLVP